LEAVLADAAGGREILARLLEIYRVTAPGWDPTDAYFHVKKPEPLPSNQAPKWAQQHLQAMLSLARAVNNAEMKSMLGAPITVQVTRGAVPPPADEGPDMQIYELATDFIGSLTPVESDALLLAEAIYSMACDYFLQHHILWPLYRRSASVDEPFKPYFDLWKHGAACRFADPTRVLVYLPS